MMNSYKTVNIPTAFYFGFINHSYTYDEGQDEGLQFIPFRAAPGNVTEMSFTFYLSLTPISEHLIFGCMLPLSV